METYSQLTSEQRYQIYALLKNQHSQSEIAATIGLHKSTVSRELRRNTGRRGYRPRQAHNLALQRREEKVSLSICDESWQRIEQLIKEDWSPQQISLWFDTEANETPASHESIYQYIYWDKSCGASFTRTCDARRREKSVMAVTTDAAHWSIKSLLMKRPAIVDEKLREGDWEVDTIIGKKSPAGDCFVSVRPIPLDSNGFVIHTSVH